MPFPESDRVIYSKNPLVEVICQLRFPAILKINTEPPVKFQELIRREYPQFLEKRDLPPLPPELRGKVPAEVLNMFPASSDKKAYDFISRDGNWTVGLTETFLALLSKEYERWEEFKEHLVLPFRALREIHKPAFFSRTGLRYQNIIIRSHLDLDNVPWSDLLETHIAGAFAAPTINESEVVGSLERLEISLDDGQSIVRIRHGLVSIDESVETGYLIDSDFFSEQETEIDEAISLLDYFNERSRRLFHWCIKDSLHQALQPTPS